MKLPKWTMQKILAAKTQNDYDRLIDRYVFQIDKNHRNTKRIRAQQHSNLLTSYQYGHLRRRERVGLKHDLARII